jgi:predicted XRE-type DNA-binding protein
MKKPVDTFLSMWDALADTPEQAAEHCGVTQPRINDLLRGRVSRFSLDALVNIATALGQRVNLELAPV